MQIHINKFGPIENATITFAPMIIFTGDSNLGKSYVNYLMYYFIKCTSVDELLSFFESKKGRKDDFYLKLSAIQNWMNSRVENFMRGFLNAPNLTCSVNFDLLHNGNDQEFHFIYSELETKISDELPDGFFMTHKSIRIDINDSTHEIALPASRKMKNYGLALTFSMHLQEVLFGKQIHQALILPPARGAFVGENYTLKEKIASSVGMYRLFLKDYDYATQFWPTRRKDSKYAERIEKLIGGKLITKDDTQYIVLKNGKELPLSAAASSIKELSPLLYSLQSASRRTLSFCVEEPEAHLHPQMQVSMVDLLALCFNDGMFFQFTTHSDYVIQRLNQLIKMEYIRQHDKKAFSELCTRFNLCENHCLKKDALAVYYFSPDENGNVEISRLEATDEGFPLVTFFEVVESMTKIEDYLNNAIEDIKTAKNNGDKE